MIKRYSGSDYGDTYSVYPARGFVVFFAILIPLITAIGLLVLVFGSEHFTFIDYLDLMMKTILVLFVLMGPFFVIAYYFSYQFVWGERKIYTKCLFYQKLKMDASQIGIDTEKMQIYDKKDKFGNKINLFMGGLNDPKAIEPAFDLIKQINTKWLNTQAKEPKEIISRIDQLIYFSELNNVYQLISNHKFHKIYIAVFLILLAIASYFYMSNINYIFLIMLMVIGTVPFLNSFFSIASKTIFDLNENKLKTKFLWVVPYSTFDLHLFYNFLITQHSLNAIPTGKSLSMQFYTDQSQKKLRDCTIKFATSNTKDFQRIMDEIHFILNQIKK